MKQRIGYIRNRYPEIRNIINKGGESSTYVQIGKVRLKLLLLSRAFEIIARRVINRNISMNNDLHAVYKPVLRPKVDVIHTFNTVCDTSVPWVSTFETMVPRTNCLCCRDWETGVLTPDRITAHGFDLLASDSCKALIALSEANRKMQLQIMKALNIQCRETIANKIIVLPPPQQLLISRDELNDKFKDIQDCINFIFIGGLFFRKGGAQILDAMDEMVAKGMKLHLTIVSSLVDDGFTHISDEEKARYERMIVEKEWITHFSQLPNVQVLELCKKAHVGLLPSMADTYGYSVLEMQAGGCPVITTDIRAMPEINNDECGYVISVPKYPSTEAKYTTEDDLSLLKLTIYQGLLNILETLWMHPECIVAKAKATVDRIENEHSPERFAQSLSAIYHSAVGASSK